MWTFHIDVVPGRFTDEDHGDVFLHRTTGDKARLKTNLDVHIEHIRKSGVRKAIRLAKIWNCRYGVGAKTFVLELLVIELLKEKKSASLSDQMLHIWTEMRDNAATLAVEDPANPSGNDLKPLLDQCRTSLSLIASTTLANIEAVGWTSVFGKVADDDGGSGSGKKASPAAWSSAVASVTRPTKPWAGVAGTAAAESTEKPWHAARPELLEDVSAALRTYPTLHLFVSDDSVETRGTFPVLGAQDEVLDEYQGPFDYYGHLFGTNDRAVIRRFLELIAWPNQNTRPRCACGSGERLSKCCLGKVKDLRSKLSRETVRGAFARLGFHRPGEIERRARSRRVR